MQEYSPREQNESRPFVRFARDCATAPLVLTDSLTGQRGSANRIKDLGFGEVAPQPSNLSPLQPCQAGRHARLTKGR